MRKTAMLLMGPQGSGKATQSAILVKQYRFVHFDMGGYLRRFVREQADDVLGKQVADLINQGHLLPDDILCQIFERGLEDFKVMPEKLILDGIPRKTGQARTVLDILKKHDYSRVQIIKLVIPEEESFKRINVRAKKEGRADDADPIKVARRLDQYKHDTVPVFDFLREQGVPLSIVDGVGTIAEVAIRTRRAIGEK